MSQVVWVNTESGLNGLLVTDRTMELLGLKPRQQITADQMREVIASNAAECFTEYARVHSHD